MSPNVTLTARQLRAVAALAGGATDERAAKAAHVCRRTVIRWRRELPHFAEAVKEARKRVGEAMLAASEAGGYEAVEQLREFVRVTPKRAAALGRAAELRLSASRALHSVALRVHEAVTTEERLAEVEKALGIGAKA